MALSQLHSYRSPRAVKPIEKFDVKSFDELPKIGIQVQKLRSAMDAIQNTIFSPTVGAPIQKLQTWLPGIVYTNTRARKIDEAIGISIVGNWYDEEIIQMALEPTGNAELYGDYTNIPFANFNPSYNRSSVVRFELGLKIGILEEERAGTVGINVGAVERVAVSTGLDIRRNDVGFSGFNAGSNNTYGLLNAPNLPGYVTVPNGALGTPQWSTKTYLEIWQDLMTTLSTLRANSGDLIDPNTDRITILLPTNVVDYLSTVALYGNSVRKVLNETYTNVRIVSVPELTAANGGQNVGYFFVEKMDTGTQYDGSTDDGATFAQLVPVRFRMIGIKQEIKGPEEGYTNATAGVICKRPYLVVRITGI